MDHNRDLLSGVKFDTNFSTANLSMEELYRLANMTPPTEPHGIGDHYQRKLFTYYLMGICGVIICSLGIIGNVLSVVVLTRKCMASTTYSYLTALAVCDILVLVFTMILLTRDLKKPSDDLQWYSTTYAYMFPYVHPVAIICQVTSIWLTLAFTVDRYIMICHPFQSEHMCSKCRARFAIGVIFVVGILFNIPRFFEYETVEFNVETDTYVVYRLTEFGKSDIFREVVHSWLYLIFVCGLPFISLAVLNAFLMQAVHKSRKRGREINAQERRRNDTTIMLIGIVIIFFICQVPATIARVMWAFNMNQSFSTPVYIFNEVGSFLVILNSAINIVPYYLFSRNFRREFIKVFLKPVCKSNRLFKLTRSSSITLVSGFNRENNVQFLKPNYLETLNGHALTLLPKTPDISDCESSSENSYKCNNNRDPKLSIKTEMSEINEQGSLIERGSQPSHGELDCKDDFL